MQWQGLAALGFFGGCALLLYPLMRAIARRIEGAGRGDPNLLAEVEGLRARVAELDALQHRLSELEERVDFAERLLAQRPQDRSLSPGGHPT